MAPDYSCFRYLRLKSTITENAMGLLADKIGIIEVFKICAWLPAFGLLTFLLPKSGRQS